MPTTLRITSPPTRGQVVTDWQREVNEQFARMHIGLRVEVDGFYGDESRVATRTLVHARGMNATAAMAGGVTPELRTKVRNGRYTVAERAAFAARVAWRRRLRKRYAGTGKPRVITAAQLGLTFQNVFGGVGTLTRTYGHYTAGPRARNGEELVRTARAVHAQHKAQRWGGCSYGPMIADDGTLVLMCPIARKAAGVAGHNTGSVHLNVPGTTGDKPTAAAEATLRWYVANAHTRKVPRAYRSPVDLRKLNGRVHKDDNPTSCPGDYTQMYRRSL